MFVFSPLKSRWNKIFKSRIIQTVALYGNTSFMVVIAILVFLLIGTFLPDITDWGLCLLLSFIYWQGDLT